MASHFELSAAGAIARAHDPDRFLLALFAPAERRETLLVLIAFNHELVRAIEMPSARSGAGPIAALIRLQWWREVVEGEIRRHELAGPLGALLQAETVSRQTLLSIIEAREQEAEGIETMAEWKALQCAGPGGMQVAFAEALGVRDPVLIGQARRIGAAYAAGAIVRNHLVILKAGRCPFPDDLLFSSGTSRDGLLAADNPRVAPAILDALREAGVAWLSQAGRPRPGRAQLASVLPAVVARRDLTGAASGPRGLGDRLALTAAWLRGAP